MSTEQRWMVCFDIYSHLDQATKISSEQMTGHWQLAIHLDWDYVPKGLCLRLALQGGTTGTVRA